MADDKEMAVIPTSLEREHEEGRSMNDRHPKRLPLKLPTDDEKYAAIEEAIQSLAREGLIVDSGQRRWSERSGRYEIVWIAVPCAERRH